MGFKIREATSIDIGILTKIIKTSFLTVAHKFNLTLENTPKHPSNCRIEWISSAIEKGIHYYLLEIENNDEPIGCCALEKINSNIGYLERLAVLPPFRKKGYGTVLVNYTIDKAKELRIKKIEIGIIARNLKLKKWYENLGFIIKNKAEFEHLPFDVLFIFSEIIFPNELHFFTFFYFPLTLTRLDKYILLAAYLIGNMNSEGFFSAPLNGGLS